MNSRPPPKRPLAADFDPTSRDPKSRAAGPVNRMAPSPYDRSLLPGTLNWLKQLPAAVCPNETAAWSPRIANRLARYWDSQAMVQSIFDELLVDRRRDRKGFPVKVQAELRVLQAHFRSLHGLQKQETGAAQRQPASPYDRAVNAAAIRWLAELPEAIRPNQTALHYPRIVNRLARFWDTPAMARECFEDLLVEKRPGRKGFPGEILSELRALQNYWQTARPVSAGGDVWSSVPERGRKGGY
jgi:hypothetical protein